MVQCGISTGCKHQDLDGGYHKCSECDIFLHDLCLQAASKKSNKPDWLCGITYCIKQPPRGGTAAAQPPPARAAAAAGGGSAGSAKKSAEPFVAVRANKQSRSINTTEGRSANVARRSSPFNQQEWLDSHCGKQNQGSNDAVVRVCGCGKSFGDGSGVNADD